MTEREAMVPDDLSTHRSQGGGPQRILPITLLVQMGMLLFTQSQAGVPMHCAVILPLLIAAVHAYGHSGKLHSQQSHVPVESMKGIGVT